MSLSKRKGKRRWEGGEWKLFSGRRGEKSREISLIHARSILGPTTIKTAEGRVLEDTLSKREKRGGCRKNGSLGRRRTSNPKLERELRRRISLFVTVSLVVMANSPRLRSSGQRRSTQCKERRDTEKIKCVVEICSRNLPAKATVGDVGRRKRPGPRDTRGWT